MREALRLARGGRGRASPNPLVGAVVAREGAIVGRGYHAAAGSSHAEVVAIEEAGGRARGATLYVSLEPCNHQGRTPPCTEAILGSGIARVVCAMHDPNPGVVGGGLARLEEAGVGVEVGCLAAEARRLNEAYVKHITTGLPFVELKIAASLDGRLAAAGGRSRWISGPESRALSHEWRARAAAVVVGAGTVRADDPALTVRDADGSSPTRIVLSTGGAIPLRSRLLTDGEAGTVVAVREDAPAAAKEALQGAGATIWDLRAASDGRIALTAFLERCAREGFNRLLVEGGARLATAFLRENLVDRLRVFLAPVLLGSDGVPWVEALGACDPADGIRLAELRVTRCGEDILVTGRPRGPAADGQG
jgi:diaminohydroxyphosphoribosylaminopyrimidine deaminase/5-amino-6-(5-phosphoribosylamino)uracil reductase